MGLSRSWNYYVSAQRHADTHIIVLYDFRVIIGILHTQCHLFFLHVKNP